VIMECGVKQRKEALELHANRSFSLNDRHGPFWPTR
jgi:hypothetical protein